MIPFAAELQVFSQNAWPSVRCDVGAVADLLPKLWSAGFLPEDIHVAELALYEPLIRRAAGIGRVRSPGAGEGTISQQDLRRTFWVCGGGSAGIIAANEAAPRCGCDSTPWPCRARPAGDALLALQICPEARSTRSTQRPRGRVFGERVVLGISGARLGPEPNAAAANSRAILDRRHRCPRAAARLRTQ